MRIIFKYFNCSLLFAICSLLALCSSAQPYHPDSISNHKSQIYNDIDLIQFSGVIVTRDSLKPVPFTNIFIKNSHRGTMTDFYGFFSSSLKKKTLLRFLPLVLKKLLSLFLILCLLTDIPLFRLSARHYYAYRNCYLSLAYCRTIQTGFYQSSNS